VLYFFDLATAVVDFVQVIPGMRALVLPVVSVLDVLGDLFAQVGGGPC